MHNRRYGNLAIKIAAAAFIIFALLAVASMQMKYNETKATYDDLKLKIAVQMEAISDLENQLAQPFDNSYIEQVARERLGLCYPDEIIVESNLNN